MIGMMLGLFGRDDKSVNVTDTTLFAQIGSPATAVTDFISATHIGLVEPITYSWTRVSGSTNINVTASTNKTVRFTGYVTNGAIDGIWKCTVTDSTGFSEDTPDVYIYVEDINV